MSITIEAVYENGVLKPKQALTLSEGTEVRVTISPVEEEHDPLDGCCCSKNGSGSAFLRYSGSAKNQNGSAKGPT